MNTLEYCLSVVVECSLMPVKFLLFFFYCLLGLFSLLCCSSLLCPY